MNIILFTESDFVAPDTVHIRDRRCRHLLNVNKAAVDQTFRCGILNGNTGTGTVLKISRSGIEMGLDRLDGSPPAPLPLTVILALPRPKMLRRIIASLTSLGVKTIYLTNSWRVEKSFWQSPVLQADALEKAMIKGLEQSGDTMMPAIYQKRLFSPFVNKELPSIADNTLKLVAHPKTDTRCPWNIQTPATLVIGPEGGFIKREIETFEKYGFDICSMGPRILNVETAVTAIISKLYI